VNAAIQIGNSKILNVLSNVFAGLEDVKELIEVVASAILPPAAKYALKVNLNSTQTHFMPAQSFHPAGCV
jgi:hypothetical protein